MAQYKVPQDVEAEDKLLGPLTLRQVIYAFIAAGLGFVAYLLFQIFPLLAVIPVPFILFLLILVIPFKKDQPMEVYLAALINFNLKPNKRFWNPGQRESTILITAPKTIEGPRIRAISEDEASHRLSFLADIVDSNGQAVRENWNSSMQDEYIAEAASTPDVYENYDAETLTSRVADQTTNHHDEAVEKMRAAIAEVEATQNFSSSVPASSTPTITHGFGPAPLQSPSTQTIQTPTPQPAQTTPPPFAQPTPAVQPIQQPQIAPTQPSVPVTQPIQNPAPTQPTTLITPAQPQPIPAPFETITSTPNNPAKAMAMEQLAHNDSYSVATIAQQANRINSNISNINNNSNINDNEVFISLH